MLYPQKGSIAIGSRRSCQTLPAAAAVVSLLAVAPRNDPCSQLKASIASGTIPARRPPNKIASMGTPLGSSHSGAITGHWLAGVVNRAFGCAALRPETGVHGRRSQASSSAGFFSVMLSHQMSPSSVMAQLVKIEFLAAVSMALRFDRSFVRGATPKKPYSGLMAYSRPSAPNFIQAMSSPTVSTFHPGMVGISIARLVLPQADQSGDADSDHPRMESGDSRRRHCH